LAEEICFFEGLFEGGFALGLEGANFRHVLFEAALDAALVESEELEVSAFGDSDAGLREGRVHLGIAGGDFVGLDDARRNYSEGQCQQSSHGSLLSRPGPEFHFPCGDYTPTVMDSQNGGGET